MTPGPRPEPELIEALEVELGRECAATHRRLYPEAGATALEIGGGVAVYMGDLPTTRTLGLGMRGPVTEADFERLEEFYRGHAAGVAIDLCPYAHPSAVEQIARRGYRPGLWKQVLVRPLEPGAEAPTEAAGIHVERVDVPRFEHWAQVLGQGFLEGRPPDEGTLQLNATLFHMASNTCWLASVDGEPAAGGCLAVHGPMASLTSSSTRPEFRRHGLHTALIRARLDHARSRGCRWARVSTLPGSHSQRNLERHGFAPIYTRLTFVRAAALDPGVGPAHRV